MVSFNCFAMGILTSFGTGYMLFSNGVMLGAFQTFFLSARFALGFYACHLVAWNARNLGYHLAGAAGLALGNGWLFPELIQDWNLFKRGAKRGLKIVVGTVPVFIMAGFIEGFLTPYPTAGYVETRPDPYIPDIYFILLYLST